VAALAEEILIVHAEPGGSIERIAELAARWKIRPLRAGTRENVDSG
jgi:hypothetical protein